MLYCFVYDAMCSLMLLQGHFAIGLHCIDVFSCLQVLTWTNVLWIGVCCRIHMLVLVLPSCGFARCARSCFMACLNLVWLVIKWFCLIFCNVSWHAFDFGVCVACLCPPGLVLPYCIAGFAA